MSLSYRMVSLSVFKSAHKDQERAIRSLRLIFSEKNNDCAFCTGQSYPREATSAGETILDAVRRIVLWAM